MTNTAKKLDNIINSLNAVEQKLEHLKTRFTCFEKRIIANETRIDKLEINQVESQIKSNQIFHYTRWITPKRVTSWRGPSPRHCARATQFLSKKCRSGGEPLATLCLI